MCRKLLVQVSHKQMHLLLVLHQLELLIEFLYQLHIVPNNFVVEQVLEQQNIANLINQHHSFELLQLYNHLQQQHL